MAKLDDARYCILQNGFMSAGASGVFKALVPIPWLEIGPLTWVTRNMCEQIAGCYGYEDLPGMDHFFAVVIAEATTAKLAAGIFDFVPGFNIGTNAVATFTLHAVTGIIVTAACELLDAGKIAPQEIENANRESVKKIMGTVTSIVYDFARGNYIEALEIVKNVMEEAVPQLEYDDDIIIEITVNDMKPKLLMAAADSAEKMAVDIGFACRKGEEEEIADYSVADVLEYNDFVKHVYRIHLDPLARDQPWEDVFAAAAAAYREIYHRNCQEGLWRREKGFDDTLAYYVAGYAKKKTGFHCLSPFPHESVAYELSKYLQNILA